MQAMHAGFLRSVSLDRAEIADPNAYPYSIPAIAALDEIEFHRKVTFLVATS